MTPNQIRCLDLYEKELRPGLPPIDRSVELNMKALAVRVQETQAIFMLALLELQREAFPVGLVHESPKGEVKRRWENRAE